MFLREGLHFDHVECHFKAVSFSFSVGIGKMRGSIKAYVPSRLLMFEYDFNRDIGL